jgi:hypothetical protein
LVLSVLFLAGCSGNNENPNAGNPNAKYYTGKDGIQTRFLNIPSRVYYYGSDEDNALNFEVEVQNKGASFSRGGIYVSGYDPNMLFFDQIHIPEGGVGACGISLGSIGFGEIGGILRCEGIQIGVGDGVTRVRIDSFKDLLSGINTRFKKEWWVPENFDFGIDYADSPAGSNFNFKINDITGRVEYYQHGRLMIALFSYLDFTLNGGQEFLLAGDTYEFPGGEVSYYPFTGKVIDWPAGLDQTEQNLLLTSCYQYTTFADPIVCIDPDPISDNKKVCTPKSKTWSGGQGAPVAVTSVEQENTPKKIIFRINVKNIGPGTVYDLGELERCSPYYDGRVTAEHLNKIYLGDVRVGNVGLRSSESANAGITCYPEVIRLDPNTKSGTTTCTYPVQYSNLKSAYQTPLVVELWYGYSETQKRTVTIKRAY